MDREDDFKLVFFSQSKFPEGLANAPQRLAEVLPSMGSHEDDSVILSFMSRLARLSHTDFLKQRPGASTRSSGSNPIKSVDYRVTCHADGRIVHAFLKKCASCPLGGGKVKISEPVHNNSIDLFGKRLGLVVSS
jgi:hypothetical protein